MTTAGVRTLPLFPPPEKGQDLFAKNFPAGPVLKILANPSGGQPVGTINPHMQNKERASWVF
jgi:hypothetical protein